MLHQSKCSFCEEVNDYYDSAIKPNNKSEQKLLDDLGPMVTEKLLQIEETQASNEAAVAALENLNVSEDQPVNWGMPPPPKVDEGETCWKCWKCNDVFSMADSCGKCKLQLADYNGDDFEEILVKKMADNTIIENKAQIEEKEEVKVKVETETETLKDN